MKTTFAVGNLGKDAEVKTINGKKYIAFPIALHEGNEAPYWADVLYRIFKEEEAEPSCSSSQRADPWP